MFSYINLDFNNVNVSNTQLGSYPMTSYMTAVLNYGSEDKFGQLENYGFAADTPGQFQSFDANRGLQNRRLMLADKEITPTEEAKVVFRDKPTFYWSRIQTDFSTSNLMMLPGVEANIKLKIADPKFYMQCLDDNADEKQYRLKIHSATIRVLIRNMNSGLNLKMEALLADNPQAYRITRLETRNINIPAQNPGIQAVDIKQSNLNPDRIFLVFVRDDFWHGTYASTPLEVDPWNYDKTGSSTAELSKLQLTLDGTNLEPYNCTTVQDLQICTFEQMYRVLGMLRRRNSSGMSFNQFVKGCSFFIYDLTRSFRAAISQGVRQPAKSGNLRLDVSFTNPLPYSISIFAFAEYHAEIQVDKNRTVTYKFIDPAA